MGAGQDRIAVSAVALTLAVVACVAGKEFSEASHVAGVSRHNWMDDVAREAMDVGEQTHIESVSSRYDEAVMRRAQELPNDLIPTVEGPRISDRFSNIELIDQHGRQLRFYDDLIEDQAVCIVFFYTRCTGSCPGTTVSLKKIRRAIAAEFPNDEFKFVSLTLEPDVDTAEELQEYIDRYNISDDPSLPEWVYATGDFEELDALRRELGVYDLDPIIDADKTEHAAIVTFGNDRTNRWAALPVGMGEKKVAETIVRITGNTCRQRYTSTLVTHHDISDSESEPGNCCHKISNSDESINRR